MYKAEVEEPYLLTPLGRRDVRDMANFCIAQGASKPWQEIAHRLLAALDALND